MNRYLCPTQDCTESHFTIEDHLAHIRQLHSNLFPPTRNRYQCKNCNNKKSVVYDTYRRHIKKCQQHHDYSADVLNFDDVDHGEYDISENYDEPISHNGVEEAEEGANNDEILDILKLVKDLCDNFWITKLAESGVTKKLIDDICEHQKEIISSVLLLLNLQNVGFEKVQSLFEELWKNSKSEYLRAKEMEKSGSFIKPTQYALNDRIETTANVHGERITVKRDFMAQISIKSTLLSVLQNKDIYEKIILPSAYCNSTKYDHPFSGERGKQLYKKLGTDYIGIQIYMDDYGTTNPLQTATATVYKMKGCYFRILNLPIELNSTMDHIFLGFLAYADDLKLDFHEILRKTLIPQLKELEQNGIELNVDGCIEHFPVILYNIVGDNLELQNLGGYKNYFRGDKCCRICDFSYAEITASTEIEENRLKTAQDYDIFINSGDQTIIRSNGLAEKSAFNDLENFHVQNYPSVDFMHDIFQGFGRHLIPLVLRSFPDYAQVYNAIKDFPFYGKDNANPPRPVEDSKLGEKLTGMTAATISTFLRLLPLIFAPLNPAEDNEEWKLLLKFQKIYDIIMAFTITNEMLAELSTLVAEFYSKYKELGGKMTIKTHYLLHYPYIIKLYGPLRHLWSMRYEAKHQMFKQYSNVNRCVKNLPMTLAWKHQIFTCTVLKKMKNENYINNCLSEMIQRNYKMNEVVILEIDNNLPIFGRILGIQDGQISVQVYSTINFNEMRHSFVVNQLHEIRSIPANSCLIFSTMRVYHGQYIRLPYSL